MRNSDEEAARTRERIVVAALHCFAVEGWHGTSFVGVAERAGVTRGAVHHHFRDKAGLLEAALLHGWGEHPPPTGPGLGADGVEQVAAFVAGYLDRLRDDDGFRTLAVVSTVVAPQVADLLPGLTQKRLALSAWTEQIRSQLAGTDAVTGMAVETATFLVTSVIYGMTVAAALGDTPLPQAREAQALARGLVLALTRP